MPERRSPTALAKIETVRLAKHPFFVVGVVATAFFLATSKGSPDFYNGAITPAFFLGVFGMLATFRLTRSMERLEEAVGTTPTGVQDRVRALCLATLLPGVLGVVSLVTLLVHHSAVPDWAYGAWTGSERVGIFVGGVVLACVGGPLLGIAAARWWRFPGAPAVLFAAVLFVVLLGEGFADSHPQAWWSELLRLAGPWTQFTSVNTEDQRLGSWTGSPWPWVAWLVVLCVLAVLAALLKGAEGEERRRLLRTGAAVGVVGLAFLALAATTGNTEATLHTPTGVSGLTGGAVGG